MLAQVDGENSYVSLKAEINNMYAESSSSDDDSLDELEDYNENIAYRENQRSESDMETDHNDEIDEELSDSEVINEKMDLSKPPTTKGELLLSVCLLLFFGFFVEVDDCLGVTSTGKIGNYG